MIDRRILVLRMVAERGTITAAAEDLGYTPSAVSHQLRTLAHDLGVGLLVPDGRRVRLTPAARTLLSRADDLFEHWEQIRAEVQHSAGEGRGRVRLVGFSTAASALLPPVAAKLIERFPRSEVRIIEADPMTCFDMLLADTADVAVVVTTSAIPPTNDPRFDQRPLLDDALDLLVPVGHRLANQDRVGLSEAADEPWIMDRPGSPHFELVLTACTSAGFRPRQAHQVVEWDCGAALVAAGLGVALVPRLARIPGADETVRVPLFGDPTPSRQVRTAVRRGTGGQPEIAMALSELRRVAGLVAIPGWADES
ncbi:LysR family transcriptional regulator [Nocardioides salsibiostraticola]